MIRVFVIGTGNLGLHLCKALEQNTLNTQKQTVKLVGYYNRTGKKEPQLSSKLYTDLHTIPECDILFIATPDDTIKNVSRMLSSHATIAHTSGSVSMNVLKKHSNYGVFYMPQSFSKQRDVNFNEIPICLEYNNDESKEILETVASTLSRKRNYLNSDQRKYLHVAAVYTNNFVNHCYAKAEEIMNKYDIPSDLLNALRQETYLKTIDQPAKDLQTGPAKRGDKETVETHLKLLAEKDHKMYLAITESIKKMYEEL
ncbi:MAG: Rossmann-like and DUF2520 domain-containing protein [Bacteroidota bacterium]|nr:Rossmann-like and DUF2520 domain-containing protein [Bacteroidota bacterium]